MKTRELAYTGILAALIAVCSWISIPTAVPFTLQTFAVFLTLGLLGGRLGTLAVTVYLRGTARLCRLPRRPGGLSGCHGRLSGGLPFYRPHHVGRRAMAGKIRPRLSRFRRRGSDPVLPVRLRLVLRGIHQLRRAGRNVHRVGLVCVPLPPARRSQAGAGLAVEPPPGPRPSDQPPLRALA